MKSFRTVLRRSLFTALCAWPAFAAAAAPVPDNLEDRPEPFVPARSETEAERYKRLSLSYYGAGMMHEQQGNREEALKHYQRALRFDPNSAAVLRQIVEVAWALERHQEAIRYALKAAEVGPANPELLERLAAYVAEEQDLKQAVELYEKAAAIKKGQEKTAGYVRLKMLIGELYARQEDFPKAAEAFEFVLEALKKPEDYGVRGRNKSQLEGEEGRGYLIMAETFLRAEKAEAAAEAVDRALKVSPNEALEAFYEARFAEHGKHYDVALKALDKYFAAESDEAGTDAYELLKRLLKATDQADQLTSKLESLVKSDPKNIPLRYFLAGEFRRTGKFDKAKPLYEELVRRSPTVEAYEGLLESGMKTNDAERQLQVLAEVVGKTNALDTVEKLVETLAEDKKLLDALVAAGRKAAAGAEPEDGKPVAFAVGLVALQAKRHETAAEFFELALLHDPKSAAAIYLSWGLGLLADDRFADSVNVFQRAVDEKVSTESPVFEIYLAMALEFDGRTDEALKTAREAAERGDGELRFESRIPWILYHAKRYQEAADAYRAFISANDADHKTDEDRKLLREARLALSNIYVFLDDLKKAEQPLEEILDEFPDDIGALNDLGYLWADQNKNLEMALEMIRKAVAKEPTNRAYRDSLGWVYYRLGRFPEAAAELELAVKGEPGEEEPDGVILEHLGDVYHAMKRADDARRLWQQAEKSFEKAEDKQKLADIRTKLAKQP